MTDDKKQVFLLFKGTFPDKAGKKLQAFIDVGPNWEEGWKGSGPIDDANVRAFSLKSFHARPGAVYQFDAPADKVESTIFTGTQVWQGFWPDEKLITLWQGQEEARKAEGDRKRAESRFTKERRYLRALEPLRRLYRNLGPADKALLMVRVTQALTSSKSLESEDD